ncbi:Ger(x)C family spore germination C-terminal domain-containing protein [Paenibacillus sp. P32E]|uniref:Ger(x)C family spore germination C-terminal domain-containing protein n=1 Tax=Paenibacillus sp. P32E TaxID=1349434 RepID=UPI003532428A
MAKGSLAKMIGWLEEEEVAGLNVLKGEKRQNGIVRGTVPKSGEAGECKNSRVRNQ